jgi:hypothetical protein
MGGGPYRLRTVVHVTGRGFSETVALAYLLPMHTINYFEPPADAYLRRLQTNLDTYWGGPQDVSNLQAGQSLSQSLSTSADSHQHMHDTSGPIRPHGTPTPESNALGLQLGAWGAELRVRDGHGKLVYIWPAEYGRMRYAVPGLEEWAVCVADESGEEDDASTVQRESGLGWEKGVVGFFLVLGSQLRWRLCVDPHHAVQKCASVGFSSVAQLQQGAKLTAQNPKSDLNRQLRKAGFPIFKPSTLAAIVALRVTRGAMESALLMLDEEEERASGQQLVRQRRSNSRLANPIRQLTIAESEQAAAVAEAATVERQRRAAAAAELERREAMGRGERREER